MTNEPRTFWKASPLARQLLLFIVYLFPMSTAVFPLVEFDTGWHLNSGRWIVEHGRVPWTDPFTTVGEDRVWIAYSWLFSLAMYGLHEWSEPIGIWLARTCLACLVVAALHGLIGRRGPSFAARMAILGFAAYALVRPLLNERPAIFSILFTIATFAAIRRIHERRPLRLLAGLPLVYAVWANVHIQWIHGLFLLGLSCASLFVEWLWSKGEMPAIRRSAILFVACAAATLVNPYGPRIYDVILSYGSNADIYELFAELKSLEFRMPYDWAVLGIFAAACFSLGRSGGRLFDYVGLAACAYFSFHAQHEVWLVVLVSATILAGHRVGDAEPGVTRREFAVTFGVFAAGLGVSMIAAPPAHRIDEVQRLIFPERAVDFIANEKLPGPICAPANWGGYIAWRLPDRRVTIDGRAALHGGPRTRRIHDLMEGKPGWRVDPDLTSAGTIVVNRYAPLAELLRLRRDYRLCYEDERAVMFAPMTK